METKSLFELIDELNRIFKKLSGDKYIEFKKEQLPPNSENYTTIKLNNWNSQEKELLFIEVLKGIHFFFYKYSKEKSFPISGFNDVLNAVIGKDEIQVYSKRIPKYSKKVFDFLIAKKIIFIGKLPTKKGTTSGNGYYSRNWLEDAAGTNDPETMNSVYWNLD